MSKSPLDANIFSLDRLLFFAILPWLTQQD